MMHLRGLAALAVVAVMFVMALSMLAGALPGASPEMPAEPASALVTPAP